MKRTEAMAAADGAPGDARERNMRLRRARILAEARRVIAEQGFDALSTRSLAKAAGVTQPTLYNLIGPKDRIVETLLLETAERVRGHLLSIDGDDPLVWIDALIGMLAAIAHEDASYYKAALIAGDRQVNLFGDFEDPDALVGVAKIAVTLYRGFCAAQIEAGRLGGAVSAADLGTALYASMRANLRDWAYDVISLKTFERRARSAHYLVLAADAAPDLRRRLLEEHRKLGLP